MVDKILHDALMIWVTIEPLGTVVLFAALTSKLSARERRKTALKAVVYSALILLGAIIGGQVILAVMNIQILAFQIAGGIILFLFSLRMIFGEMTDSLGQAEPGHDISVYPLAVPSIVGAETIMVVIVLTDNSLYSIPTQAVTALVMLGVLAVTYGLMLLASPILRAIGQNGAAILERVMGIILAALSIDLVIDALYVARWIVPAP